MVKVRKANSLPSLNGDGDNQEDAGRKGKVTAAFKEWEDKVDEAVTEAKMKGQNKKIRQKKDDIGYAEAGQELVEQV